MGINFKDLIAAIKEEANPRKWDMTQLAKNFFEGLFILVPVVVTVYVMFFLFEAVDGWLNIPVPGLGFIITIGMIILAGRLASNVFFRGALGSLEKFFIKTPFIKLVYTSIKDLIEAFMGEKKRFDQPVVVTLNPEGSAKAIGFVTRKDLSMFGLMDHVAVYFPQSYNFAGHLLVFPREQVKPLGMESSDVMTFIVSGGVSGGGINGQDDSSPPTLPQA
jgi:uncharacterized membrane protein